HTLITITAPREILQLPCLYPSQILRSLLVRSPPKPRRAGWLGRLKALGKAGVQVSFGMLLNLLRGIWDLFAKKIG
ncbi:hypothetical protein MXD62_09260, partial [Frankia sp. Mgl5]|nr:hypothetical protein [Frankia sp. Mgl5]